MNAYLEELLESQRVGPEIEAAVRARRAEIEPILTARGWSPRIYYGGSYAKRTMIAAQFDLDLVVYFPRATPQSPRDLYASVEDRLRGAGHHVLRHNVALRLQYTPGWHIDVVPGRALDDSYEYADLWSADRGATRQTSLKRHIELARNGNRDLIRLLKLWRRRHLAPIPSFALELIAARATDFRDALQLLANLEHLRLVDPANSNNIVTDDLHPTRKQHTADLAVRSLNETSLDRVIW
jgi:hypothetical protein